MKPKQSVVVWGEFRHERSNSVVAEIYPQGIHETIASFLRTEPDLKVRTVTLNEPEHGLSQSILDGTDEIGRAHV